MTYPKAWAFQVALVAALREALPDVPIHAEVPTKAPDRYIRIDGFTVTPLDRYKQTEDARHGVTIHAIDSPAGGTRSLSWVKQTMGQIFGALIVFRLDDQSDTLRAETGDARLEPRADNGTDAHALARFITVIR